MLFFVFLAVILTILNFQDGKASSDDDDDEKVLRLIKNLIQGLEDVNRLIIEKQAKASKKQEKGMKKMAKDLDDLKKSELRVETIITKQSEEDRNNYQHVIKIETRTGEILELLHLHDQRLQNLSKDVAYLTAPEDCSDVRRKGFSSSGVYRIFPNVEAYCDFNTPGGDWLVIQRRRDGSVDFNRNWTSYANGFGNVKGELWLGNEILHQLTSKRKYKLRIDLEDFETQKRFAEYSSFSIGPPSDHYRLQWGGYSGDAVDSLAAKFDNPTFSASDADRDCGTRYESGWWFNSMYCIQSNLNGRYLRGKLKQESKLQYKGIYWKDFHDGYYSLKATEMKIARLN